MQEFTPLPLTPVACLALYIRSLTQRPAPEDDATAQGERLALSMLCGQLADMASATPFVPVTPQ